MKAKKTFICDSCGAKVSSAANQCPNCKKFFLGVRCPRCKYSGKTEEFKNGCPVCGYLAEDITDKKYMPQPKEESKAAKRKKEFPMWFYGASLFILLIALMIIIFLFFRR